ncbi:MULTISPECIES: glutathione S-transferase family protein [Cyanophyceae]|uniref:glutathione S-transferase family protein n=1 Tax=Cyanophyceae TaxID=3028117 RepID=UPI0016847135|nr:MULTISPECIES: glutathione S-transferase family protein [Cyanophyceae]MBD1919118.1 glutathione S-transferase family protein [Phormidium sp. FACHB-77]MBD2033119.1 glutathione S-transferase family protein [Phormidium sp. FACHB-322]MBD2054047.1 glutathione S-transferase family protein [Leptolyngbya sp. FACHB-60]
MLELYQFEASSFAEKIRLILDYKQVPYHKVEVTPGVGQVEIFQMSGQRQVPVLKDGEQVIPDSTAIALHLEKAYPDRPLIPTEPKQKGLCLALESWADEAIVTKARVVMIGAFKQHPNFRTALLPSFTPAPLRSLVGALPGDLLNLVGTGVGFGPEDIKVATAGLRQDLEALVLMLQTSPYLLGDQPTLADFAVAAATMYLKFPTAQYVDLPEGIGGKGVPGIADVPEYRAFFDWRDRLYAEFRTARTNVPPASPSGGPTPISID